MEATLQLLFNITKFRKAIYNIPTSSVDGIITPTDSPALALQRLFYRMQCGTECPCRLYTQLYDIIMLTSFFLAIAELVQSFGWTDRDINSCEGDECIEFLLAFLRSMDDSYFSVSHCDMSIGHKLITFYSISVEDKSTI